MRTGSRSGRSSREAEAMRCRKCKGKAVLDIPRHHTAFCKACLTEFVCAQVERAVAEERMFTTADRVLVAVSGWKDSLSLLNILRKLGYQADAFYVDLGIGEYSRQSKEKVERYTGARGIPLYVHELKEDEGAGINDLADLLGLWHTQALPLQSNGGRKGL